MALWNLGFRPFYLAASVFAVLSVPLWAAQSTGLLPFVYLREAAWHGHEMLFGYTVAVLAGFLLTAVRNWTGEPTPSGAALAALVALWAAGRVLVLTPFAAAAAAANAAFPAALAVAIARPLVRARNVRNYFFVALLLALGALVLAVHLALLGTWRLAPGLGLQLALDVVLFIMAVMGGRVIPMFTNNGVPGAGAVRNALVERLALSSVLLLLAADALGLAQGAVAVISLAAAAAHGVRLLLWRSWRTLAVPLVWVLHAGYAWIVVHFALRGAWGLGAVPESVAVHALTVGAIGGLTLGMMTRTARGHTGRPLVADRFEAAAYLLVQLAALVRVAGGVAPAHYAASLQLSGLLWGSAFAIYALRYWPVLTRPRLDGRPG